LYCNKIVLQKEQNGNKLKRETCQNRISLFELKRIRKQSIQIAKYNNIKIIFRRILIDKKEILDARKLYIVEILQTTNKKINKIINKIKITSEEKEFLYLKATN
jgi:hypothetical protein